LVMDYMPLYFGALWPFYALVALRDANLIGICTRPQLESLII
jgi:hypothetical protein